MKKYILPIRQIDRVTYNLIESGEKRVETRAAGPRYKDIKNRDIVVFKCGKDSFERIVKKVQKFKSVDEMLDHYDVKDINPRVSTIEELKSMYNSFYSYTEKIRKYGIIAFELLK
ncbi:ASCH domain-containing protein [Patescibacteria group bacterium]|nr:ASCH domain-containing protein [Patescibacteria group bacterium]